MFNYVVTGIDYCQVTRENWSEIQKIMQELTIDIFIHINNLYSLILFLTSSLRAEIGCLLQIVAVTVF